MFVWSASESDVFGALIIREALARRPPLHLDERKQNKSECFLLDNCGGAKDSRRCSGATNMSALNWWNPEKPVGQVITE